MYNIYTKYVCDDDDDDDDDEQHNICFALIKFALIKRYHLHMCNNLAIIWKVAAVKFSNKLPSNWNNISKRFETSKWFELTLGLM